MCLIRLIVIAILIASHFSYTQTMNKKEMTEKVKSEFLHAWNAYKKYAWKHDDLKPLSKTYKDWYSESLLMTPVDAFDTMILMGLKNEAEEAKQLIKESLSFDKDISVKNFEITIRLLGGLLSAYELDGDKKFLELAEDLGNRLLPAFDSPTGMPYTYVNLKTGKTSGEVTNPAEIGTLIVEFGTLSKLTKNSVYFNKAKKALIEVYKRRSKIGLVGTFINVNTGEWANRSSHISGCIDSYYEYLLKGSILFKDNDLKKMWKESIKSINKYLRDDRYGNLWYGTANMDSGKINETSYGSLDAFFPAVLALGGDLKNAKLLQESCFKMWQIAGIEPEQIDYSNMKITNPYYVLRPEIIESAYYLYNYTKDEKYLRMGETFLNDLIKYCKTDEGYAALKNVITKEKDDQMESFFFAETLKYLYLLFDGENTVKLDKVIFNTEAHPVKR